MRLSVKDILELPFDESLSLAGATYTCRSIHKISSKPWPERLRQMTAETSSQLAFRRWLESKNIKYELINIHPITRPEQKDLLLGGRRIRIHTRLLSQGPLRRQCQRHPSSLLAMKLKVQLMTRNPMPMEEGDLHVFTIALGDVTRSLAAIRRASAANMPLNLIATPPHRAWNKPSPWRALGRITLDTTQNNQVDLQIAGLGKNRGFLLQSQSFHNGQEFIQDAPYFALIYIQASRPLSAPILVFCHGIDNPWFVGQKVWRNIWVYGKKILVLGWMTQAEIRKHALLPFGQKRGIRGAPFRSRAYTILAEDLRPTRDLIRRMQS